jgi:hypothetical protein
MPTDEVVDYFATVPGFVSDDLALGPGSGHLNDLVGLSAPDPTALAHAAS